MTYVADRAVQGCKYTNLTAEVVETAMVVSVGGKTHCCYWTDGVGTLRAIRLAVIDHYPFEQSALFDAEQNSIEGPAVIICAIERLFNPFYTRV